ncbi:MAG: DUF134 domain-containing protein [Candidatus Heimdallarchaeaceae archaeon]
MTGPNFRGKPPFHRGGRGRRYGKRCRGRGRPPIYYPIEVSREDLEEHGVIELSSFELKILQYADLEELTQHEIAEKLQISQTSVWRYLNRIRARIAEAISRHKNLQVIITDILKEDE